MSILQIAGYETLETLLPSCIPKLKAYNLSTGGDVLADEINADSWLSGYQGTFFEGSN